MNEVLTITVPEKWAHETFGDELGQPQEPPLYPLVQPFIREIVIDSDDARLDMIRQCVLRQEQRTPGFFIVFVSRKYSDQELTSAELFRLLLTPFVIDGCGQDYGTEYDETDACPKCGAGRRQTSPLILNTRKIPRKADITVTIAFNEWVVSERFARIVLDASITGCHLEPVIDSRGRANGPKWYQLVVVPSVQAVQPARFGINYFLEDRTGEYACPQHGLSGLGILSELYLDRATWNQADIASTTNRIGRLAGWMQPSSMLVISPRLAELLKRHKIRGYELEVAHLV